MLYHCYADDAQLYVPLQSTKRGSLTHLTACLSDINCRTSQNLLKLNNDKTEIILLATPNSFSQIVCNLGAQSHKIKPTSRNCGVLFDSILILHRHYPGFIYYYIPPILASLHWLPVFVLILKFYCWPSRLYMTKPLTPYEPRRPLRLADSGLLVVPRAWLLTKDYWAFAVQVPKLCKGSPTEIRLAKFVTAFKSLLKTIFFKKGFISVWMFLILFFSCFYYCFIVFISLWSPL